MYIITKFHGRRLKGSAKEKVHISCYTYSQSYSCTSANQQSVNLNDRHSKVDEY